MPNAQAGDVGHECAGARADRDLGDAGAADGRRAVGAVDGIDDAAVGDGRAAVAFDHAAEGGRRAADGRQDRAIHGGQGMGAERVRRRFRGC